MLQVFFAVVALVAASVHLGFSAKRRSGGRDDCWNLPYLLTVYLCGIDGAVYRLLSRVPANGGLGFHWMGDKSLRI